MFQDILKLLGQLHISANAFVRRLTNHCLRTAKVFYKYGYQFSHVIFQAKGALNIRHDLEQELICLEDYIYHDLGVCIVPEFRTAFKLCVQ